MRSAERAAPIAAALSALATLACCLPLGIAGAVGALGLSVALAALRPWLIGIAIVLLAYGFWQRRTCRRHRTLNLVVLLVSAAIVLAVIVLPQQIAELLAAIP